MLALLTSVLGIILINVVLSGDNALVIGMASRNLAPRQRRWAVLAGGAAAIVLRVIFTFVAVLLLKVPLLQAGGGLLLVWIAYQLLEEGEEAEVAESDNFLGAVRTIVFANLVMSLDNMLAVAGAANGNDWLVLFGLVVWMPFVPLRRHADRPAAQPLRLADDPGLGGADRHRGPHGRQR